MRKYRLLKILFLVFFSCCLLSFTVATRSEAIKQYINLIETYFPDNSGNPMLETNIPQDNSSISIKINPLPQADIEGPITICLGATAQYSISDTMSYYSWSVDGGNIIGAYEGNNVHTINVTWDISGKGEVKVNFANAKNCSNSDTVYVAVNDVAINQPDPVATTICYNTSTTFILGDATGGTGIINYQWLQSINGIDSWIVAIGTNNKADYTTPPLTSNMYYKRVAYGSQCGRDTTKMALVTVNLLSVGGNIVGGASVCLGINNTLLALEGNVGSVVKWQLSVNPFTTWTDINDTRDSLTYTAKNLNTTTKYRAVVQSGGGCSADTSGIATITVQSITPSISISANLSTICQNEWVAFTANIVEGEGDNPSYQWKKNGNNVGGNANTYEDNTLVSTDTIVCILTSSETCANPAIVMSNKVSINVNSKLTPTISVTATPYDICAGTNVTFATITTNGGDNPFYLWKRNGIDVGSNSTYSANDLTSTDTIICMLTSSATCVTSYTVASNKVNVTVNNKLAPTINIEANFSSICQGTSVNFTATATGQGSFPFYQWKKNNRNVGTNSSAYTDDNLESTDTIICVLTSSENCADPVTATSNPLAVEILNRLEPTINIAADLSVICPGTNVTFTATTTGEGSNPFYQWKKNGNNVGTNSDIYADNTLNSTDTITCILTSSESCASPAEVESDRISISVSAPLIPTISVSASSSSICEGSSVTFMANVAGQGSNPSYQWKKNGNNVGTNSNLYTDNTLTSTDVITCTLTSSETCANPSAVSSTPVKIAVAPKPEFVFASPAPVCRPNKIDLTTLTLSSGNVTGITLSYWNADYSNNITSSANAISVSGTYHIIGTNTVGCGDTSTVMVVINPKPEFTFASPAPVCQPNTVDLTALTLSSGSVNNLHVSYWNDSYSQDITSSATAISTSGTYHIVGRTAAGCGDTSTVFVTINSQPTRANIISVSSISPVCSGNTSTLTATTSSNISVIWYSNAALTDSIGKGLTFITPILTNDVFFFSLPYNIVSGCKASANDTAKVNVTVNQLPVFISCPENIFVSMKGAGSDTVVDYIATASGIPTSNLSYSFSGATTGSGSGTGSGSKFNKGATNVKITASNSCGASECNFIITVESSVDPCAGITASLSGETAICEGASAPLTITFTPSTGPWNVSYTDGVNLTNLTNITKNPYKFNVTPNSTTTYTLLSVSKGSCTGTIIENKGTATVIVNPTPVLPVLQITGDMLISKGDATTLTVTNSIEGNIRWYADKATTDLLNEGMSYTTPALEENTSYYLRQISDNECESSNSQKVNVIVKNSTCVLVPQAITPNGDGSNDNLIIQCIENYPNNRMQIYNRWGDLVYKKPGYNNQEAWDGYSNVNMAIGSVKVPTGTYFYVLELNDDNKTVIKGFIEVRY